MENLYIAQVSDIHITGDGALFKGSDVCGNFIRVLNELKKDQYDLLILSGDLAADNGEPGAYMWLQKQLDDFAFPVLYMMGNHDKWEVASQYLNILVRSDIAGALCYAYCIKQHLLIFLDTSSHSLSVEQIGWLQEKAATTEGEILLFMHHPPVYCDCKYMDSQYYLRNRSEVWEIFRNIVNIRHIFCGHYHTEKTIYLDEKLVYVTPSTFLQINTKNKKFNIEHKKAGWREIKWNGSKLITYVNYLSE